MKILQLITPLFIQDIGLKQIFFVRDLIHDIGDFYKLDDFQFRHH